MAEPLTHLLNDTVPPRIADMVYRAWPHFDRAAFVRAVEPGYAALGLMARGERMAQALRAHLPQPVPRALEILVASMDAPLDLTPQGEPVAGERGYSAFVYLPHSLFIAAHGLGHFTEAMAAQHALTQRFTAEYCLRPYLRHHREATLAQLRRWTQDHSAHVRRLVSEGTRPRLPWAPRLPEFQCQPQLALPLLSALRDDPSSYVRRSVANHLGDIAKDHPALAVATARQWLQGATPERSALVRHSLRYLVKRGDAPALDALDALGFGHAVTLAVRDTQISPERAQLGVAQEQRVLADLRVGYARPQGAVATKVFKLRTLVLAPGATADVVKTLSLKPMTTRTHYPGTHTVELLLNGRAQPLGAFTVQ